MLRLKKTVLAASAVAAVALTLAPSRAEAQVFRRGLFGGRPRVFSGPGGPTVLTPGYGYGGGAGSAAATPAPATAAPYSYFAVPPGTPARTYVPYGYGPGGDGFPYYGRPYGHVYDRWSWGTLSGSENGLLYRYYSPPLG